MEPTSDKAADVVVVGGGPVGCAAALAAARAGCSVIHLAPPAPAANGRTIALLGGSIEFLDGLGVWRGLERHAAPLETLTIVDDTDNLFRPPPLAFRAAEIGRDAFGWNIPADALVAGLSEAVAAERGIRVLPEPLESLATDGPRPRVVTASGTVVTAGLVVGADGRGSAVREAAGIRTREWRYPQTALTTILAHDLPHRETSTEFHTREGPFTLVPLPGRRSSLVWVRRPERAEAAMTLSDEALAAAIEKQAHSMLGAMRIAGPRGLVPMRGLAAEKVAAPGVVLVGEAAHVFPPIGAQGLNLGLRDVAALGRLVSDASGGAPSAGALARFDRERRLDMTVRTAAVDMLDRTLLADFLPADFLRGAGLVALSTIGPLRRFVMRRGLG